MRRHPPHGVSLTRRMTELERALMITVILLMLVSLLISASGLLFEFDQQPDHRVIPEPQAVVALEVVDDDQEPSSWFLPGSLDMTRTSTMHKCFVRKYSEDANLKLPSTQGCSKSAQHRIVLYLTPKSGSSTGRHVVKNDFGGVDYFRDRDCRVAPNSNDDAAQRPWITMAVLRNPATRAFAAYEEMFVRRIGKPELVPANSRRFMESFRGWTYPNYSALFDSPQGVAKLNRAYEEFMEDWDGQAFDVHLESQVAYNLRRHYSAADNSTVVDSSHLDLVVDTHNMEDSFAELASRVGLQGKRPKVIRGRAYPRRLNVSHVSDLAYQAMCRHYKDDFCCLNYVLPPPCLRATAPGTRVRCQWADGKIEAVVV